MATIIREKNSPPVNDKESTATIESELDKDNSAPSSPDLLDQVNSSASPPDSDKPAPDGGARAWIVAAGGAAILFCCLGFSNSFGAFEQYYLTHQLQGHSPDKIAWIGSISAYLQFGADYAAGGSGVRVFGDDAESVQSVLADYVGARRPNGRRYGFPSVPCLCSGVAVLRQEPSRSSGSGSLWVFYWWSSDPYRAIEDAEQLVARLRVVTVRPRLTPRTTAFWLSRAYTEVIFVLLMVSMFFIFMGMLTPLFYLPTYAVARGMDPALAGYLLAIVNASSTFGRIIPGVLADKYGRLNVFAIGGVSTGIAIFCMNSAKTNSSLIGYGVVFGFTSGTIISGLSACISLCAKDPREIGMYMGMGMSLSSLGGLIGPPVNGVFVHHYGGFFEACMFSGAVCLFGGFIAVLTKIATPQGIFGRV
ncbi:hypothetical protein V499_06077 [Pseudogymnoascus sp. VKM F-103]|nr:hypothetical protein V499_06077 [Pseudogymnoascus sp. VKM F-103]